MTLCTRQGCSRVARGRVPGSDRAPAHVCKQCSEEHCEMAAYLAAEQPPLPYADTGVTTE